MSSKSMYTWARVISSKDSNTSFLISSYVRAMAVTCSATSVTLWLALVALSTLVRACPLTPA